MNDFLQILEYMHSEPTKPEQLPSWQASRHDEMWESRLAAAHNQLHCHDREDKPRDRRAYRCRRQQSQDIT